MCNKQRYNLIPNQQYITSEKVLLNAFSLTFVLRKVSATLNRSACIGYN